MANTKKLPSQCGQPGCEKRPTYGLKGSKKREFCSQHAKKGMINVNNKRCIQPNCSTIPSFAVAGSKKAEFCSQHAMEGMVDVRSKRSSSSRGGSINKQAVVSSSGKTPASSSSSASSSERASGGLGLGGPRSNKRCGRRGCSKRPSYAPGASGENAEFCDQHATDGILVGGVLRGLGDYRGGGGAVGKAVKGTGAGAGAGVGAAVQRYSGDGLMAGTKRKHPPPLTLPPHPVSLPAGTSSALPYPYPLTTPEYLQGSSVVDPPARSNKRALAGAGGATTTQASLALAPPLMPFRPPSKDRYTGAADSFQFRPHASDRYLGGGESSLQSAALAATAVPLMQQFRPQSAERYALGDGDSSQQFRSQSDRYLGGPTALTLPDTSSYSEDIASVFDKDVKL
eukprot:g5746.t1